MNSATFDVVEVGLPGQQTHEGVVFPLMLAPREAGLQTEAEVALELDAACAWIEAESGDLLALAERHGAVLFRGFPVRTAQDFDRFVAAFGLENFAYEDSLSNAVRVNRTPRVFTANEARRRGHPPAPRDGANTNLSLSALFLLRAAGRAGRGDADLPIGRALDPPGGSPGRVHPPLRRAGPEVFERHAVGRRRQLGNGPKLAEHSPRHNRAEAEAKLKRLGYTWQWLDDGCLRATTPVLPAVHELAPGRTSFFNQLIAAARGWKDSRNDPSRSITFGDGSPLDPEAVALAVAIAEELSFDIPWQQGDVALVDNMVAMHGRRRYQGTRKVLASLVAAAGRLAS